MRPVAPCELAAPLGHFPNHRAPLKAVHPARPKHTMARRRKRHPARLVVADAPGLDSALAWTPFAVTAVRRTWPAAVVLAASFPSTPSTGRAFPLICNANTSSFMRSSPLAGSNPGPAHQEGRWGPSLRVGLSLVLWSSGYAHAAKSALASWRS